MSAPGTLTLSLSHSTPPSAVSWHLLEGRARRPACLLWQPGLSSLSPAHPPHPTLLPNHHKQGQQLPATMAPTWQVHTPVSMPTCLAAPMTASGHCSKLPQSFHTPTTCPVAVCPPTHYTLYLHLDIQLVARGTWSQVRCPKGWSILPTSQLPGTESSRPGTRSQLFLNPPQDK